MFWIYSTLDSGRERTDVPRGQGLGQIEQSCSLWLRRVHGRANGVDIDVNHTAKQYWTTSHDSENRDIIFQEELI